MHMQLGRLLNYCLLNYFIVTVTIILCFFCQTSAILHSFLHSLEHILFIFFLTSSHLKPSRVNEFVGTKQDPLLPMYDP